MKPPDIIFSVREHGCRLAVQDGQLLCSRQRRLPPELLDALRAHKRDLLSYLEAREAKMPPDCAPWLHIAKQVLAGEFEGCDRSTRDSLIIGLRGIAHPATRQAMNRLQPTAR